MNSVPDADNRCDAVTKANSIIEAVGFVPADGEVRETHRACGFIDDMVTSSQREAQVYFACRVLTAMSNHLRVRWMILIFNHQPFGQKKPTFEM